MSNEYKHSIYKILIIYKINLRNKKRKKQKLIIIYQIKFKNLLNILIINYYWFNILLKQLILIWYGDGQR